MLAGTQSGNSTVKFCHLPTENRAAREADHSQISASYLFTLSNRNHTNSHAKSSQMHLSMPISINAETVRLRPFVYINRETKKNRARAFAVGSIQLHNVRTHCLSRRIDHKPLHKRQKCHIFRTAQPDIFNEFMDINTIRSDIMFPFNARSQR